MIFFFKCILQINKRSHYAAAGGTFCENKHELQLPKHGHSQVFPSQSKSKPQLAPFTNWGGPGASTRALLHPTEGEFIPPEPWGDQGLGTLSLVAPKRPQMRSCGHQRAGTHMGSRLKPTENSRSLIFKQKKKKIKILSVFLKYLMANILAETIKARL